MIMPGEQFKLAFPSPILPLDALFSDDQGQQSLSVLRRWQEWPKSTLCVTGPENSGVTSILKSWAKEVDGRYLVPTDWENLDPKALSDLLSQPLCLDDCHRVQASASLLTILNLAEESGVKILIGGHGQPSVWHVTPPDLVSRLAAMTTIMLPAMDDEAFIRRLRAACLRRFIRIPEETLSFLEPRLDRSFQAIEAFADRLDRAMTETKRPATIPLARDVLNELIEEWETDEV